MEKINVDLEQAIKYVQESAYKAVREGDTVVAHNPCPIICEASIMECAIYTWICGITKNSNASQWFRVLESICTGPNATTESKAFFSVFLLKTSLLKGIDKSFLK